MDVAEDCFDESDEINSCCSTDISAGSISSFSNNDDDFDYDLSDLRDDVGAINTDGATNESCSIDNFRDVSDSSCQLIPGHYLRDNTVIADEIHDGPVQNSPTSSFLSPDRHNEISLHSSVGQPMFPVNSYVIVGDNIDKNVRPAFQRLDRSTQSLHYFHSYAVLNRIDISGLSDNRPSSIDISPDKILPNHVDIEKLLSEFEVLVARYVCLCLCLCVLAVHMNF